MRSAREVCRRLSDDIAFGNCSPRLRAAGIRGAPGAQRIQDIAAGALIRTESQSSGESDERRLLKHLQIDSKFGTFTAVSTAVLRKRIGEINAMVVMEKVQGSKEYLDSIKEGGLDAMSSALSLMTKPVQTVSGAVQGLGAAFSRVGEGLFGSKRSQSEESKVKDLIGFSTTKRQYAFQFDVDVYSENQKLQDMLNRISWAG